MEEKNRLNIMVVWRGEQLNVDVSPNSKFEELGKKLQKLTSVKPDTMKLLVPQSANKISKLIAPFSDEHSSLSLQDIAIVEGKPIRMMGVFDDEIKEVSQNSNKSDLRIAGFDEEEKRLKQLVNGPHASLKLPQGAYIFCDFRTLHIPGIELNPPPSEALRRMHMLACDPGIIAIMNKHRWRVGVLTEMAPVGYVGISPKCILGFNMNKGEEISLRLRTDDLNGFRKYESIKKTLLHELAHMVYSEHDANFFALDRQLNQEAASLDWTKSASHTLSGRKLSNHYEEDTHVEETNYSGRKLGGTWNSLSTARASSVAAAYNRFFNASSDGLDGSQELAEDVYTNRTSEKAHHSLYKKQLPVAAIESHKNDSELKGGQEKIHAKPDPDDALAIQIDVMHVDVVTDNRKPYSRSSMHKDDKEPDPDDCLDGKRMFKPDLNDSHVVGAMVSREEPDPDDSQFGEAMKADEPDPDDSISNRIGLNHQKAFEPDPDESGMSGTMMDQTQMEHMSLSNRYGESDPGNFAKGVILETRNRIEPYPDISQTTEVAHAEPDLDDHMDDSSVERGEPDPNDHMDESKNEELQRMEEPVAAICSRLQKAIEMLRSEVTSAEATSAIQTLFKIIRNVIEHPDEAKFRRLRKANPHFQRNVANYKAAIEVLTVVGFCEDVILDEVGRAEAYMVLKRNDPGLLWLAKSSLEVSIV